MTTMRAILVHKFGGPPVLQLQSNLPIPRVTSGKVLVRVKAAGVNPVDTYIREGSFGYRSPLPYTPGKDGAGLVEEVGDGVEHLKKGDRVFFCNRNLNNVHGSYAQYSLVDGTDVWSLPSKLSFPQGAALGVSYFTAYRALVFKARTSSAHTVLVHGASGSVGTASVQIAKRHLGCKVIGTAGTPGGLDVVRQAGADLAVCHRDKDYLKTIMDWTDNRGVDVILEMLANVNLGSDLNVLGPKGNVVVIGSRGPVEIHPRDLFQKESSITGVSLLSSSPEEWEAQARAIMEGGEAGWVEPVLDRTYVLAGAKAAHHDIMHSKGAKGHLIINPDT